MDKISKRVVNQNVHKKGLAPEDIYTDKVATPASDVPSYATVKCWVAEFKRGRQTREDDPVLKACQFAPKNGQ